MESVEKIATPLDAVTVLVPLSVPLPGLLPMAIVMLAELLVTVLPKASWTVTWTPVTGLMVVFFFVLPGWTVNASWLAAAGVMVKVLLVAAVSPLLDALSVYPLAALLIDRLLKVATPLTAVLVAVPLSVPPPGLVLIATVMDATLLVTVFPPAS
jgi:hypothetical protein